MQHILIFRHLANEGPGYFAEFLQRNGIAYTLIAIDQNQPVPESLENVAGLVFMGGPMSVNDPLPWIADEIRLIQQAFRQNLPILGHCLGGQLISKALGGRVGPNPVKEIGWLPVRQTMDGGAQDWLRGLPESFEAFHWHGETFSIPSSATTILSSAQCPHQGFVIGNTLALQCHVEMTADMVRDWAQVNDAEIAQPTATIQSAAQMAERLPERIQQLHQNADVLYTRWLRPILSAAKTT
jgi:GMP synthase-like glutamine amidotransferase